MHMKKIYISLLTVFTTLAVFAQQEVAMPKIPPSRELHHEMILNSLTAITKLNRRTDTLFPVTGNKALDQSINRSVKLRVNNMRAQVELNSSLSDNDKFKWLRGINEMLTGFISAYKARLVSAASLSPLVKAYEEGMKAELAGNSILPIISANEPEIGSILIDNFALKNNAGIPAAKDILVLKLCKRNPTNILRILSQSPDNRYADSLIIKAALRNQEELYTYAAAP